MDKTDEVSIFKGMSDKQKNLNNVFSGNIKCCKEKYSKEQKNVGNRGAILDR